MVSNRSHYRYTEFLLLITNIYPFFRSEVSFLTPNTSVPRCPPKIRLIPSFLALTSVG